MGKKSTFIKKHKSKKHDKHPGLWTVENFKYAQLEQGHFRNFDYFKDGEGSVLGHDLNEFFQRTTIAGVSQLGSRRGIIWRLFWFLLSVAGLSMSLYQSKDVLLDFINDRTTQGITYRNVRKIPFPSLTVCSNVRLTINSKEIPRFAKLLCKNGTIDGCFRTEKSNRSRGQAVEADQPLLVSLLALQAQTPEEERSKKFYGDTDELLTYCSWKGVPCNTSNKDIIFFFNNLLRGSCMTFNPGFNQKIYAAESREFVVEMRMKGHSRRMKFNDVVAMFWMHSGGTAAPLYSQNGGRIFPGDKVRIDFRVRNITRLESQSCISSSNQDYKLLNAYYSDERPYENDIENCIFYKETQYGKDKGCYHASVSYENLAKKLENSSNTLCATYDCFRNCSKITDSVTDSFSNECKALCNELSMTTNLNTGSLIIETLFEEAMLNQSSSENFKDPFQKATRAIVQLSPESNVIEDVIEEPKYSVADFLGILGGNFGLWVGVSIISLAELLELAYMLARFSKELWFKKQGDEIMENSSIPVYTVLVKRSPNPQKNQ